MAAEPRPSGMSTGPLPPGESLEAAPPDGPAVARQRVLAAAYRVEAPAIYAFIARRVGSAADAEDLTAEAFLRALRGRFAGRIIHTTLAAWQRALG